MVIVFSVLVCAALVGIDQFLKYLVVEYLKPIEYYDVIDGVLRLRYVENTGAVFGSFATHTMLLTVFSIVLLAFTIYFLYTNKGKSKLMNICLLLMISGGIGNIIDRIRLHYVVDYIEPTFVRFAVFNFADCLITVGAFILIGYLIADIIRDYKKGKADKDVDSDFVEEKISPVDNNDEDNNKIETTDEVEDTDITEETEVTETDSQNDSDGTDSSEANVSEAEVTDDTDTGDEDE